MRGKRFIKPDELNIGSHLTVSNVEDEDGEHVAEFTFGGESVPYPFDRAEAVTYAIDLVRAGAVATYQVAMCRQLTDMGVAVEGVETFLEFVNDVLDETKVMRGFTTTVFTCQPGVVQHEGKFHPVVVVDRSGELQHWDVEESHRLALGFLAATLYTDLDTIYQVTAVKLLGVSEDVASKLVVGLPIVLPLMEPELEETAP